MSIDKTILTYLKNYSYNVTAINRLITSVFCQNNEIVPLENEFIKNLLISEKNTEELQALKAFSNLFKEKNQSLDFECLIELFEFVVSPLDKVVNGAVYTPQYIRKYIINSAITRKGHNFQFTACDVACGCGGFLYEYALEIHLKTGKEIIRLIEENLFGVDITDYSIQRTKILLTLLALSKGEDKKEIDYNLFIGDSLEFNWFEKSSKIANEQGFDFIFSNPPYVGSSNLDENTKHLMKNWSVASTGKLDLYIPFFEIGIKWLKNEGVLGYITVNNFYRSLNGRALRDYFSKNSFKFKLIDFGGAQVFQSRLTYTCICEITKSKGKLLYTTSVPSKIKHLKHSEFIEMDYQELNDFDGWHLDSVKAQLNIKKLENAGKSLNELFNIRNGFATLRNNIYLLKPLREDDLYFYFEKNAVVHKIEKGVCRDAVKPNILKEEKDVDFFLEKLIFPYDQVDKVENNLFEQKSNRLIKIIDEVQFKKRFPQTFKYLKLYRSELAKRDKGQREYETWFAYGRSQALDIRGKKLLFPYMSNQPYFVYTDKEDLLFYNGYAILSESEQDLKFIQKLLKTRVFWYYIKHTSKPYANKYFALAKNYIKNFSIPDFTEVDKRKIMSYKNNKSLENFLLKKYNITDIDFEDD